MHGSQRGEGQVEPGLPIVDLEGLAASEPARRSIAGALDRAFRDVGFCYVVNAGIDTRLVDAVMAASRSFHGLPLEEKQSVAINAFHRGYMAMSSSLIRTSSVARVTRPNLSESFMVMHEVAADDPAHGQPLQGPNQWPGSLPGFRGVVLEYLDAMTDMARRFTRLIALALRLQETHLDAHFERPTVWLRLLHYPPLPPEAPADQYGAAPHTDYGFLTFLAQDSTGGLEVRRRDGRWIAAPPIPGAFVVNVADMLARWTNGIWVSTAHRVRNVSGTDRYSLPFFWDPSMDSTIECLSTCLSPGEVPRHPPVHFGAYVMERLNRNYDYRKGGPRTDAHRQ